MSQQNVRHNGRTVLENTQAARDIIAEQGRVLTGHYFFGGCFCAMGAYMKASLVADHPEAVVFQSDNAELIANELSYLVQAIEVPGWMDIILWNDRSTYEEVLAGFDKALNIVKEAVGQ